MKTPTSSRSTSPRAWWFTPAPAGTRGPWSTPLLHRFGKLSSVGGDLRPGIVHRLDRFTSGVILVARSDAAHRNLAEQFASRAGGKDLLALVHGRVKDDQGRITTPIARDPVRRVRMTARLAHGRQAITSYQVAKTL